MTRARDLADSADKDIAGTITLDAVNASGVITGLTVEATGDTAAGDNAAMGYTAAEGLILTGQGSSGDITIKNDADAVVLQVPTGTTNVNVIGSIDVATNAVIDGTALVTGVLTTTAATVHNGGITMPDGAIAKFGTDADLQISHINGTGSLIRQGGEGNLFIQGSDSIVFGAGDGSETLATFTDDGGCTLNFNNEAKIATASGGVTVTGQMAATTMDLSSNAVIDGNAGVGGTLTVDSGNVGGRYLALGTSASGDGHLVLTRANSNKWQIGSKASSFDLFFYNYTAGGESLRLNAAGNMGLGISTINNTYSSSHNLQIASVSDNNWGGTLTLTSANGSSVFSRLVNSTDGLDIINQIATPLRFFTGNTVRAQITAGGDLLVGATAQPSATTARILSTKTGNRANIVAVQTDAGGYNFESRAFSNGGVFYHFLFEEGTTVRGSISSNGSNTTYATSSDYRLKENVVYDWDATTRLKQLKPARFNFIGNSDTTVDGFLAHEAEAVVPESVVGTKDEVDADGNAVMQGIDQAKLVPLLVKTILELEARITALEG